MEKVSQKLKDLNDIKNAASKVEECSPPPLQYPSVIIAGIAMVGVSMCSKNIVMGGLAGMLAAWGFQKFGPLPIMSWEEILDDRFTEYEPVDEGAYANLHETTRSTLKLDPIAVYEWVRREKLAILSNKKG